MPKIDAAQQLSKLFEPIRKNRFYLEIDGVPSWMVKTFSRPKIENGEIEIDWINNKRFLAGGKSATSAISMTLHDPIEQSGKQAIIAWQKAVYDFQTGRGGYSDDYMKEITIKELSPSLDIVSETVLHRCFPTSIDLGDLDYSSGEEVEISLSLRYDSFEIKS